MISTFFKKFIFLISFATPIKEKIILKTEQIDPQLLSLGNIEIIAKADKIQKIINIKAIVLLFFSIFY